MASADYSLDRGLPASPDAEKAILGACILENGLVFEALSHLDASDFYLDTHRRVFAALAALTTAGKPTDTLSVAEELGSKRELDAVGGVAYLSALTDGVPRRASIEHYIHIVRDHAKRRSLIASLNRALHTAINDRSTTTDDVLSMVEDATLAISSDMTTNTVTNLEETCLRVYEEAYDVRCAKEDHRCLGLPTGIPDLDVVTTGYRPGEVIVVGGWPGTGKSCLAVQALYHAALRGVPTLMFSIEMPKEEVFRRLVSMHGKIPYSRLRDPRYMTKEQWTAFDQACGEVAKLPIFVDDSGAVTASQIAARSRIAIKRDGVKLVALDYVQLVDAAAPDERVKTTRVSKMLRQLAKEEEVPVLMLSQLSRPKDADRNARPTMFNLKESGSLEADAHKILLLFRPVKDDEPTGYDEIIIAKQRGGVTGLVEVTLRGENMTYLPRVKR